MELTFTEPQNKQFYTARSHKEFCSLCDKDNIPEDKRLAIAEKMGIGFGYKYMYELENALRSYNVLQPLKRADGKGGYSNTRFDTALETASSFVCSRLNELMSNYILERDGLIDCWPSPEYTDAFTVYLKNKYHEKYYDEYEEDWVVKDREEIAAEVTLPYHHFGGEYTQHVTTTSSTAGSDSVTDSLKKQSVWEIKRKDNLHVQVFHYCPEINEEFRDLSGKIYKFEEKYKFAKEEKKKTNTNFFKKCIIAAPTVVTIIVALLSMLWTFTGIEELEDAVNMGFTLSWLNQASQGEGFLKIITIIPAIFVKFAAILWFLVSLIGSFFGIEKITVVIAMLLLVAGGFMVSMMINESFIHSNTDSTISKKEWKEARKAKREATKIKNNPRFKVLQREHADTLDKYMDFCRRWQTAWFNAWKE